MMAIREKVTIALLALSVAGAGAQSTPIYSYTVPSPGGYDPASNLLNYNDTVNGAWSMTYTNLNQLQLATATGGQYQGLTLNWTYDSFGNRLSQTPSGTSSASVPAAISASYGANNQMQSSTIPGISAQSYDATGNLLFDGINQMAYDAEDRVCAVYNTVIGTVTQYIYDAEGRRVAKVAAPSLLSNGILSCAAAPAGQVTAQYVLDESGEQVTEVDGSGNWKHTNVYAGGQLLATYDQEGTQQLLHFNISDPLGTKRVQASASGVAELDCLSLPYGDSLTCNNTGSVQDATEHHFTGKIRDAESGLDYFGARHYASTMGRFMSPDYNETGDDPEPVPHANLEDPQSLNQYAYVGNNPLTFVDVDGHSKDCGGGGDKSVVCLVTSFWDWLTSGSSNAGSNSSHGDVAPPGGPDPNKMPQLHNRTALAMQAWGDRHPLIVRALSGPPCTDPNGCIKSQVMPFGMTSGLGLGLTGTKAAATIAEQLALEAAEANPANGKVLQTVLNDYRWPASKGWVKMESTSPGGVVVHWVRNLNTGEALDFKLK